MSTTRRRSPLELISLRDLARQSGVSFGTLRGHCDRGELQCVVMGGGPSKPKRFVRPEWWEEFLDSRVYQPRPRKLTKEDQLDADALRAELIRRHQPRGAGAGRD